MTGENEPEKRIYPLRRRNASASVPSPSAREESRRDVPLVKQRVLQAMHDARLAGPKALADAAEVDPSTIHRLGQKGSPDMKTLEGIARATGKTVDWLMGRDEPEPPAALATLIRSIDDLVLEMRLEREREQDAAAAMMRSAKALARALRPPGSPRSTERPVRDGTVG